MKSDLTKLHKNLSEYTWLKIDKLNIDQEAKIILEGFFPQNKKKKVNEIIDNFVKLFSMHLSNEKFEYEQQTCNLVPYFYLKE